MENAHQRKKNKYSQLQSQCEANGWKTKLMPIEVGSRGFMYHSCHKCLQELGIDRKTTKTTLQNASLTSLRCSYAIYLSRNILATPSWMKKIPTISEPPDYTLIDTEEKDEEPQSIVDEEIYLVPWRE